MGMYKRADEVVAGIVAITGASSEQEKEIHAQVFSLFTDLQIEFSRVVGNHLDRAILRTFEKESL